MNKIKSKIKRTSIMTKISIELDVYEVEALIEYHAEMEAYNSDRSEYLDAGEHQVRKFALRQHLPNSTNMREFINDTKHAYISIVLKHGKGYAGILLKAALYYLYEHNVIEKKIYTACVVNVTNNEPIIDSTANDILRAAIDNGWTATI